MAERRGNQTNKCFSVSQVLLEVQLLMLRTNSIIVSKWNYYLRSNIFPKVGQSPLEAGHSLVQVGGFRKVTLWRKGQTPTKLWGSLDQSWISTIWQMPSKIIHTSHSQPCLKTENFTMLYSSHPVSTYTEWKFMS